MILQGTAQRGRRKGRQKKRWEDNVTEWAGLKLGEALQKAENREEWRTVVAQSSLVPQRSTRLRDKRSEVIVFLPYKCKSQQEYDIFNVPHEKERERERKRERQTDRQTDRQAD